MVIPNFHYYSSKSLADYDATNQEIIPSFV